MVGIHQGHSRDKHFSSATMITESVIDVVKKWVEEIQTSIRDAKEELNIKKSEKYNFTKKITDTFSRVSQMFFTSAKDSD